MKVVFNKVTWYSWWGALVFFLFIFPALCFYIGRYYEGTIHLLSSAETINNSVYTPTQTSRLKTHRNFAGSYEVKYPLEWMITGYEPTANGMDVEFRSANNVYNFSIITIKNTGESIEAYVKRKETAGLSPISSRSITVAGLPGLERHEQTAQGEYYSTYAKKGTTLYILRSEMSGNRGFTDKQIDLYRSLVSTFILI